MKCYKLSLYHLPSLDLDLGEGSFTRGQKVTQLSVEEDKWGVVVLFTLCIVGNLLVEPKSDSQINYDLT